ncbi:DASH complex subunit Dam1-domain-containing protein [Acrodontium crateriforme]|uniref:DASH complex subunit DAM1 n=1 Tax=Acrodontium crateriforme TaxID=150365 RepID=A0AAQ3R554_9PEZI|nr:DASH complex subunit Dam1-domain-containing protein [Acrodontium crateriforme]
MAATTTTPLDVRPRSTSRTRSGSSSFPVRPTTPLRPLSRTSLRASQTTPSGASVTAHAQDNPLAALEPAFAELSDGMADLEANFLHLQLLHESLGRFNENFGAFLYGMNMSAFCVDFPEAPITASFARQQNDLHRYGMPPESPYRPTADADATFLTSDTTFVENPPASIKPTNKYAALPSATSNRTTGSRGSTARGARGSGIGRGGPPGSGARGGRIPSATRGSGIGRGTTTRGRGIVR